jgi:hypothetical protein
MCSLRAVSRFMAATVFLASAPLAADDTITRTFLGRTFFYPPNQIHVTVTVGSGAVPLPAVSVSLSCIDSTFGPVEATTDERGSVAFLALKPGQYVLTLTARTFLNTTVGPITVTEPTPTAALLPHIQVVLNPAAGPTPANIPLGPAPPM